jgi:hypothetical protein
LAGLCWFLGGLSVFQPVPDSFYNILADLLWFELFLAYSSIVGGGFVVTLIGCCG